MKNLYIFDMGGVLVQDTDVFPAIANYLGISLKATLDYSRDQFDALMDGSLSAWEFWRMFEQRSGLTIEEELLGKFFNPSRDDAMYALIRQLKGQHRVVCGTNTLEEHYAVHLARGDYDIFEKVYASHLIGLVKPHQEFYVHILAQEQFLPEQAVFIDDNLQNVETANFLGIHSIHFTNVEQLRDQLSRA